MRRLSPLLLFPAVLWPGPAPGLPPLRPPAPFAVPAGFEVQLVAQGPELGRPRQIAFDGRGRLWVATSADDDGNGRVLVLSDFGPDGKPRAVREFAKNLNAPVGLVPLPDGKSCLAACADGVRVLRDTDGDGIADDTRLLFTAFDPFDPDAVFGPMVLLPDGWVYAGARGARPIGAKGPRNARREELDSAFVVRFRPDGANIDIVASGRGQPAALAVDPWLNLFAADRASGRVVQLVPGAVYGKFGDPDEGLGFAPTLPGDRSALGMAYYAADHFPEDYRDCLFVGNAAAGRVERDRVEWTGATPRLVRRPDFLTSPDPLFHVADVKLGPDGALYVADHGGRVLRVVWKGIDGKAAPPKAPFADLAAEPVTRLVDLLVHPNQTVRLLASAELAGRDPKRLYWSLLPLWQKLPPADPRRAALLLVARQHDRAFPGGDDLLKPEGGANAALALRALAADGGWAPGDRDLVAGCLRPPDFPRLTRAACEVIAVHPHHSFVERLVVVVRVCPADDPYLAHAARLALRNCLQTLSRQDWADLPADFAPVVDEVAFSVPTTGAAGHVVTALKAGRVPPHRLTEAAERVGRFGDQTARDRFLAVAKEWPDRAEALALLRAYARGGRARSFAIGGEEGEALFTWVRAGLESHDPDDRLASLTLLEELTGSVSPRFRYRNTPADPLPAVALLAKEVDQPDHVRETALDVLLRLDPRLALAAAEALIDDRRTGPRMRERAGLLLAASPDRNHKVAAKDAIRDLPHRSAVAVAAALARTRGGAEVLLTAVRQGKAPARVLDEDAVLVPLEKAGIVNLDFQIIDLTRWLTPADPKVVALVGKRAAGFRSFAADPAAGAKVYAKHCAACHRVGESGGRYGPALDGVGPRGVERLLEDVLDPNRNVDAAYRARTLTLTDGRVVGGLLMLRVEAGAVVFADGLGKELRVPVGDIEKNRATAVSAMPANFGEVIPEPDLYHLLAFLLELRPAARPGG